MKIAKIQFVPWDKVYHFSADKTVLKVGDYVIVETKLGREIGRVVGLEDSEKRPVDENNEPTREVLGLATKEDLELVLSQNKEKNLAFSSGVNLIRKHQLPIKLVDVHCSFDGTRLTFAFISDGRVDFRELLKDLNREFKKSIRLQQIGIRDEIKMTGDIGCCGRDLCCQKFYKTLGNVTSDLAAVQQVAHRGSDRLSGVCGRLKCCLTFEEKLYNELANNLPLIGERIKTPHGYGQVINWHVLRQTVDVVIEDKDTIMEIPIEKQGSVLKK